MAVNSGGKFGRLRRKYELSYNNCINNIMKTFDELYESVMSDIGTGGTYEEGMEYDVGNGYKVSFTMQEEGDTSYNLYTITNGEGQELDINEITSMLRNEPYNMMRHELRDEEQFINTVKELVQGGAI